MAERVMALVSMSALCVGELARLLRLGVEVDGLLRRLSDPYWFQALGCVLGMDWHSSGITTSVVGALKRGLEPVQRELGLYVCGGRGRHSRKTPQKPCMRKIDQPKL